MLDKILYVVGKATQPSSAKATAQILSSAQCTVHSVLRSANLQDKSEEETYNYFNVLK
jgi:hypothetical protein